VKKKWIHLRETEDKSVLYLNGDRYLNTYRLDPYQLLHLLQDFGQYKFTYDKRETKYICDADDVCPKHINRSDIK
jgi:hypothetical protein